MTDLAATLLARLDAGFSTNRNPDRAEAMAKYMRDQFPYFGVPAPALRTLERVAFAGLPPPSEESVREIALACWQRPQREFHYVACDYLQRHPPSSLPLLRELITTKSWWDTVDPLATRVTGALVRRCPALAAEMDTWSRDDNLWLVRTAILHQLHYGEATDTARLASYCSHQAGHKDFFVRKAIGWALRHYARTNPDFVRSFVIETPELSPLSVREATKHL